VCHRCCPRRPSPWRRDRAAVASVAGGTSPFFGSLGREAWSRIFRDCKNVVGVKDATGNLVRPTLERMACGPAFSLLSGEDMTALGYMAHGGHGCRTYQLFVDVTCPPVSVPPEA
jgi:hypothetical protein